MVHGRGLALSVFETRRSNGISPFSSSEHKRDDPSEECSVDDSHDRPGDTKRGGGCERQHVESKCERERLSAEIQQRGDLRRLWLVAICAVSKDVGANDLKSESSNAYALFP
jgi:hypothetical protein